MIPLIKDPNHFRMKLFMLAGPIKLKNHPSKLSLTVRLCVVTWLYQIKIVFLPLTHSVTSSERHGITPACCHTPFEKHCFSPGKRTKWADKKNFAPRSWNLHTLILSSAPTHRNLELYSFGAGLANKAVGTGSKVTELKVKKCILKTQPVFCRTKSCQCVHICKIG